MSNIEITDHSPKTEIRQWAYADYRLKNSMESGRMMLLLPAVINLLMLFADLTNIREQTPRAVILIIRVAYSVFLLLFLFFINKLKSFRMFCGIVSFLEVSTVAIFLYVFSQYPAPDFMIQALGLITIILAIFLIPNTWNNMVMIFAASEISFLILAKIMMPGIDPMQYAAGAVYITIDAALCAFFGWNRIKLQRREFEAWQELTHQNATDHLTQAANRFKLEEEAKRLMVLCRREKMPLSLVFVDVDNLKSINDEYGHLTGDDILSELVIRMRRHLRASDIVARWGGDEFILLLPYCTLANSAQIAESIRQSIISTPFTEDVAVTCSFGVVTMQEKSTFETLLREADDLMYTCKKHGKNCVEKA